MKQKRLLWLVFILLMLTSIVYCLFRIPTTGIDSFNKWYDTKLSEREIAYIESGIVDSEFFARIPLKKHEFDYICNTIGMKFSDEIPTGGRVYWCKPPPKQYFLLDRTHKNQFNDRIEGHYDEDEQVGYFHYWDH